MFWQKSKSGGAPSQPKAEKLPRPKGITDILGRYLVTELKQDPDWVWKLKVALRHRQNSKNAFDFRVFDEVKVAEKDVKVHDYTSFDQHPELVLFQGWYDKESWKVEIEGRKAG